MRPAILIADDDPPLLTLLETIVARTGDFDVVTCRDGETAIRELSARHFDVVILDAMLPERSGFPVLEYLRQHRAAQLRVVLVLTAGYEPVEGFDPSVVHALVAAPFDCDDLVLLIRKITEAGVPASIA
jgi:two-component system OmpR family response regulator